MSGQYTIAFNLYDQPVGGSPLWSETHYKVGVINGMINVFLGSITPLTNVDFGQTRHLGITIYADNNPNNPAPEMVPRQMIIPAFWAKRAENSENSEKLAGFDWTPIFGANNPNLQVPGTKIQNGSITGTQIANASIGSAQLASSIITSNHIVNGSIAQSDLGPRQVGTNVGPGGVAISLEASMVSDAQYATVDVTNLTVTVTTTGRPVILSLIGSTNGSFVLAFSDAASDHSLSGGASILFLRGAQIVDRLSCAIASGTYMTTGNFYLILPPSSFHTLDTPPAGTWTYKVQLRVSGPLAQLSRVRLMAYEL